LEFGRELLRPNEHTCEGRRWAQNLLSQVCFLLAMLTIERVKKILNDPTLTDQQVEEIRDGFHYLVEDVIFPAWLEERNKKKDQHEKQ